MYFLLKAHCSLHALRDTRSPVSTISVTISTQHYQQKAKDLTLNRLWKGTETRELNKKAEWCLVWSQLGMWTLSDSNCLPLSVCMSANDRKITANIDFRDKLILPYRWACRYGLYEYQYWLHVRWSWLCLQLWPFLCFCICG